MATSQRRLRWNTVWNIPTSCHRWLLQISCSRAGITSTSVRTTIGLPALDKIFSMSGVPDTVRSDNGPPFNSAEFKQFASYLGFKHRKVTPYWPRANGQVERIMRTLKKAICSASTEGRLWKQELSTSSLEIIEPRHIRQRTLHHSPHYLDTPYTRLPAVPRKGGEICDKSVATHINECDKRSKLAMKRYSDTRNNTDWKTISFGDQKYLFGVKVAVTSRRLRMTPGHTKSLPCKKCSMVSPERDMHKITQNISQFKVVPTTEDEPYSHSDDVIEYNRFLSNIQNIQNCCLSQVAGP